MADPDSCANCSDRRPCLRTRISHIVHSRPEWRRCPHGLNRVRANVAGPSRCSHPSVLGDECKKCQEHLPSVSLFFSCQQTPRILQPQLRGMATGHRDVDFPNSITNKAVFFNIVTGIWARFHVGADYRIIPDAKTKSWRSACRAINSTTHPLTFSINWLREWAGGLNTTLHISMSFIRRRRA